MNRLGWNASRGRMRATNFSWSKSIDICVDGLELDMHNCFDFRRMTYDVQERSVTLEWARGSGAWVSAALPRTVTLIMIGVSEVRVHPRDAAMPFSEDDCLSSFGYDTDEDWAHGQFWVEDTPDPGWRWSFQFQSGAEIQVSGDTATVRIAPATSPAVE